MEQLQDGTSLGSGASGLCSHHSLDEVIVVIQLFVITISYHIPFKVDRYGIVKLNTYLVMQIIFIPIILSMYYDIRKHTQLYCHSFQANSLLKQFLGSLAKMKS
jgi:hypothetical protein